MGVGRRANMACSVVAIVAAPTAGGELDRYWRRFGRRRRLQWRAMEVWSCSQIELGLLLFGPNILRRLGLLLFGPNLLRLVFSRTGRVQTIFNRNGTTCISFLMVGEVEKYIVATMLGSMLCEMEE